MLRMSFRASFLGLLLPAAVVAWLTGPSCSSLTSLHIENTTITNAFYQAAGTNFSMPDSIYPGCGSTSVTVAHANVCRVQGFSNTSSSSSVAFEAWLPDVWYGRFMGLGNGGLDGCFDWPNLDYTTTLHFAAIGSNNGHYGDIGVPFLHQPEVINDFSYRSIHVEAVIGKQIVEAYYRRTPEKSYYLGCSTGGRQAIQTATMFPEDFDGFVAGAPAINWNVLLGSGGIREVDQDFPLDRPADGFITPELWPIITNEIMKQCDALDGLVDRIISEPDNCNFDTTPLLCPNATATGCLNEAQSKFLQNVVYSPILDSNGKVLSPRVDPGSEDNNGWTATLNGSVNLYTDGWYKFAVYNDSNFSFNNFSLDNVEFANTLNPGNIDTWNGDLKEFKERGGKILTYHGRSDPLITSGNSNRLYDLVFSKVGWIDDFYRFFPIPGMEHCISGPGNWLIGQGVEFGGLTNVVNDTSHNILLALVDWVENGLAPNTITGLNLNGTARTHCRYPFFESIWNGTDWICQQIMIL